MKVATFWDVKCTVWSKVTTFSEGLVGSINRLGVSLLHPEYGGRCQSHLCEDVRSPPLRSAQHEAWFNFRRRFSNAIKEPVAKWFKHREEILCSVKRGKFLE
jgi:hypothetical protein